MTLHKDLHDIVTLGGLGIKKLTVQVYNEIQKDQVLGYGAQLAYYFFFSIFPFFIFLAAMLAYIPIPNLMDQIMEILGKLVPEEVLDMIQENVKQLVTRQRGGRATMPSPLCWGRQLFFLLPYIEYFSSYIYSFCSETVILSKSVLYTAIRT